MSGRVCSDAPPSGRGGGGQRGLRERLLPGRQRAQRRVPALDLAVRLDRVVRHLGKVHGRAEREICQRQRVAGDESLTLELTVEHLGCALEQLRAFFDRSHVRLLDPTEQEIGRASCRERVWIWGGAAEL